MGNKITLGLLKQLIREELNVLKKGKIRLNEQDGDPKIYKITSEKGTMVFFVAVSGDKVYNVTGKDVASLQVTNEVIGGGNTASFVQGIKDNGVKFSKSGIYSAGLNVIPQNITAFFATKTNDLSKLAYGLVVENGVPALIAYQMNYDRKTGEPIEPTALIRWTGREFGGGTPTGIKTIPGGSSGTIISRISLGDGFEVNQYNLNGYGKTKLDKFIDASIKYTDKMQEKYFVVISSASADKSTSIQSDNELSNNRAKTVVNYLNSALKKYGYTFEYVSLGQTWGYDNGASKYKVEVAVNAGKPKSEIDQLYKNSSINRKVEVVAYSKYKSMLPPNGTYTGSDKLQKI